MIGSIVVVGKVSGDCFGQNGLWVCVRLHRSIIDFEPLCCTTDQLPLTSKLRHYQRFRSLAVTKGCN